MSKTTFRGAPEVFDTFQEAVMGEWGKLKGAQNEAINEAVLLWLAYKKDIPVAILNHSATGRKEVILQGKVSNRIAESLANPLENVGVWPVGKGWFVRSVYVEVSRALRSLLGKPKVAVEDLDTGVTIAGPLDNNEAEKCTIAFFEFEDGLKDKKLALLLSW